MPTQSDNIHIPSFTAVIQARMESTRLPGKALLDLAGKPLICHVIERSKRISGVNAVVLATGRSRENLKLVELGETMGIKTFRGSDANVLERFYEAAMMFGGDYIVRITGDNPFMDPAYASKCVELAMKTRLDLCSIVNLPLGVAVEIVKFDALERAYHESSRPYHFEHVTPYIKENGSKFRIERHRMEYDNPFPGLRLTVDEPDDYRFAGILYEALYPKGLFLLEDIIGFLKLNPSIVDMNRKVIQRSMTEAS